MPLSEGVHDFVVKQALARPGQIAVVAADRRMTYAALDAASGRLAKYLESAGVGPGDFVAIALPRDVDLVVAIVAIARTGAVYCALDVGWPGEHVTSILRRLGARYVVTDDRWQPDPARQAGAAVIDVAAGYHAGRAAAVPGGERWPSRRVSRDDPCCVFFTSGTTGAPKGSVSPHRAITRLLRPCEFVRLDPTTVIPATAPVMWDAFALELWGGLLNGGTVVLNTDQHLAPATLRSMITTSGVNTLWLTCSLFNLFVEEDIGCFAGVRAVMTGGERMSPEHARRFLAAYPDVPLVNGYGPVECTIFASTHRVRPADAEPDQEVPIGTPVPGTRIALIDQEIYIGGDGLALGYANDPDQTAQRFVRVPVDGATRVMYRTGDLGSKDAEGLLRYHGRADRQLKISGHRVEPAAIERLVIERLGVAGCAVLGAPDADGRPHHLAAFYTGPPLPSAEAALAELRLALPRYLVPHDLIHLAAIPLTATGKRDNARLLALLEATARPREAPGPASAATAGPVATDMVTVAVSEIYADVLGGTHGLDSSFWTLGGTSLDALRICARLSARLGITVPAIEVLRHSSADDLADWLRSRRPSEPAAVAAAASQVTPLYPTLAEAWLQGLMQPDSAASNCLMCWHITGSLEVGALRAAAADVQRRHEALRVAYVDRDGAVAIPLAAPNPLEFRELRADPAAARRTLLDLLYAPFDLVAGPPWRLALVSDGQAWWFGVAVSHVAFDGWSESILAADLSLAYRARREGRAPDFAGPAPTLRDLHEEWQRELASIDLDAERAFWRSALVGIPMLKFGPAEEGTAEEGTGGTQTFELTADDLAACVAAGRDAGASLFTVLLAAFVDAVRQVTGQADFGVGVPFAQRNTAARSAAVACLMGMLCVRPEPADGLGPAARIAAAGEALHGAMAHAALPLPEIVRLSGARRNGRSTVFRTVFVVQDNDPPWLELNGCAAEYFRPPHHAPVADLVTEVWLPDQPDGGARVVMSHRPAVSERVVRALLDAFAANVAGLSTATPAITHDS